MLTNFHTHTNFSHGKENPEEIVIYAIEKGFSSIGFTGHSYTDFDLSYCMTDTAGYMAEINRLKEKYKGKIQIYLGVEEDIFSKERPEGFDYIIGSAHYVKNVEEYYPIDYDLENTQKALEVFGGSLNLAESYFDALCGYIEKKKPDIVGHFDLITKFDEKYPPIFLGDKEYLEIAKKYLKRALKSDPIFEINTGAISRGLRTKPYPCEELLYELLKGDGKIILSSDAHQKEHLDFWFKEAKEMLLGIGFKDTYIINNSRFERLALK